jgi:hypothetical protein
MAPDDGALDMKERWLNNKQPDENGDIVLVIENNDGHRVSTFKGKTLEEVTDALVAAAVHANRQLGRYLKPDSGRTPMRVEPREITPEDRLRYSTDITDPSKVVEVVDEIMTARQGAPPAAVGKKLSEFDQAEAEEYCRQEAVAFMNDYPAYYPVEQNKDLLIDSLNKRGWDLTRNNLAIIYQGLLNEGKLVMWPQSSPVEEELPPPEPVATTSTPQRRNVATGLRNSDANASKPAPPRPKPIITRAALESMSRAEYNERIRDPIFRRAVDALA